MNVTKIDVWKNNNDTFVANGKVEFDNCFFVKFKAVKSSKDGSLFISFPSTKGKDKEGNDSWFNECGYVFGEDEETKYTFKNELDSILIAEVNKTLGIKAIEKKEDTKKEEPTGEKKSTIIKFGPKK